MTESNGNGYATRDSFMQAAAEVRTEEVELPNGQKLKLQSIPASEAMRKLEIWQIGKQKEFGDRIGEARIARSLQLCARNPDGSVMFTDDDLDWLMNQTQCGYFENAAMAALQLIDGTGNVRKTAKNSDPLPA